jgi:KDO2-lipid IV(A) lauroyltransferase
MLVLFKILSRWPLPVLHALGAALGWGVWWLSPAYRRHFRANVAQAGLAFEAARPAIADAGRFVAELPRLWMRPHTESCLTNVKVLGRERVDAALAQGRGVVFFSAHCGSFELAPQALAELYGPVTALYRPARQPWLAQLMAGSRARPGLVMAPANLSGIRQMLKALRSRGAVALLTDQVPPEGLGLWAPFFGRPAYSMTLAARLVQQSGAALIAVRTERLPGGQGYQLEFLPPVAGLHVAPALPLADAVALVNRANEQLILSLPGQYLWAYARYKQPRKEALAVSSEGSA